MGTCDFCGTTILFGGVKDNDLRFCNDKCHQSGYPLVISRDIPDDIVNKNAEEVHKGACPKCQGPGPIDVHTSFKIYSLLLFTSYNSVPSICCRSCGIKSQVGNTVFSMLFGWWGFPYGILMTPVQIIKNVAGIIKGPDKTQPSEGLNNMVRLLIAEKMVAQQNAQQTASN
ncbi:MAG: hypothetical protein OEM02_00700 [Desulfobulbaceae bacterium]|nr:hypothetical protein [Desulfobulbaceae bacterium]